MNEDNKLERGSAKITIELTDGTIVVRHGGTDEVLFERKAPAGSWDALWEIIKNYPAND